MAVLPMHNPAATLTPAQVFVRLGVRAAVMSSLQSAGVVLLAQRSPWCLVTAFLISWLWIANTRDTVDYRQPGVRLAYASGGMVGCGLVLLVARYL